MPNRAFLFSISWSKSPLHLAPSFLINHLISGSLVSGLALLQPAVSSVLGPRGPHGLHPSSETPEGRRQAAPSPRPPAAMGSCLPGGQRTLRVQQRFLGGAGELHPGDSGEPPASFCSSSASDVQSPGSGFSVLHKRGCCSLMHSLRDTLVSGGIVV